MLALFELASPFLSSIDRLHDADGKIVVSPDVSLPPEGDAQRGRGPPVARALQQSGANGRVARVCRFQKLGEEDGPRDRREGRHRRLAQIPWLGARPLAPSDANVLSV